MSEDGVICQELGADTCCISSPNGSKPTPQRSKDCFGLRDPASRAVGPSLQVEEVLAAMHASVALHPNQALWDDIVGLLYQLDNSFTVLSNADVGSLKARRVAQCTLFCSGSEISKCCSDFCQG